MAAEMGSKENFQAQSNLHLDSNVIIRKVCNHLIALYLMKYLQSIIIELILYI